MLPVSDDGGSTAEIVRVLGRLMFPTIKSISLLLEMSQKCLYVCVKSVMMVSLVSLY